MIKYLGTDFRRFIKNWRFYGAAAGVVFLFFYSLERNGLRGSVLETYIASVIGSGVHLAGVFCSWAFVSSFCEGFEHRYMYYEIVRGNLKKYLLSKVIMIYVSSVIVMLASTVLFCGICAARLPWAIEGGSGFRLASGGNYGNLVLSGHYLIYCLMFSLQLSMYMAVLAEAAALLSLFTTNMVLVLTFPVLLNQILVELRWNRELNYLRFCPVPMRIESDLINVLYLFLMSIFFTGLLWIVMYRRIKQKL